MALNLLEKTELWINNITLKHVNLTELAAAAADVLKLPKDKVLVVDVRPSHVTLDILAKDIPEENIIGKQKALLEAFRAVDGVCLGEDAFIHSNGILGLICLDDENPESMSNTVRKMADDIKDNVSKRAIIFPTGFEIKQRLIEDTNSPYLQKLLKEHGYKADVGTVIQDNISDACLKLDEAVSRGYGLIITTGGVGAEDKDYSVEAVLRLDPNAAVPYIAKFQKGTGRHVKDGVRIAVGRVGLSLIVALPGPHDEVVAASGILIDSVRESLCNDEIANRLVSVLAKKLMRHSHH